MFNSSAYAELITGEIEYNREGAKNYVIQTPAAKFDINQRQNFLIDKNNSENLNYLYKGITELKDRKIAKFSDDSYGIMYYEDPLYTWYYSSDGRLINFTQKNSFGYPCKFTKYKPDGSITNTGVRISEKESYIYNSQGKLIAHWVNENCYDEYNNIIMKRKIYD